MRLEIEALSIRQPWAWLIVHGLKDIENRTWRTAARGRRLIHAGKGMTRGEYDECAETCERAARLTASRAADRLPSFDWLRANACGGVVGAVDIVACVHQSPSPWFFGPYGFALANAKPLPFIPCKGALGFFKPEIDLATFNAAFLQTIAAQLELSYEQLVAASHGVKGGEGTIGSTQDRQARLALSDFSYVAKSRAMSEFVDIASLPESERASILAAAKKLPPAWRDDPRVFAADDRPAFARHTTLEDIAASMARAGLRPNRPIDNNLTYRVVYFEWLRLRRDDRPFNCLIANGRVIVVAAADSLA